jgi:hypothetical protein
LHWAGAAGKTTGHVNGEAVTVTTEKFGLDDEERFCTGEDFAPERKYFVFGKKKLGGLEIYPKGRQHRHLDCLK